MLKDVLYVPDFAVGNFCSCASVMFCLTSARSCEVILLSFDDESTNYG